MHLEGGAVHPIRERQAEARGQFRTYELARQAMLLFVDLPAHMRFRQRVAKAFTPVR